MNWLRKSRVYRTAAVLGSGPDGLFAAHALKQAGWDVTIFANDHRKTHLEGAQYLLHHIPGLTKSGPFNLDRQLRGSSHDYRQKVYGSRPVPAEVRNGPLVGRREVWDLREAYDRAWSLYGSEVEPGVLDYNHLMGLDRDGNQIAETIFENWTEVFSTISAPAICGREREHQFSSQMSWVLNDSVDFDCPESTIICDGTEDAGWYRLSNVFGHKTVEYPAVVRPPFPGVENVHEPLSNQCDCYQEFPNLTRTGKYGRWAK